MDKCKEKYNQFIKTGDMSKLKPKCYYEGVMLQKMSISNKLNPIDNKETCKLINSKKKKYYIHTSDPSSILTKINNSSSSTKDKLIDHIKEIFDMSHRVNCCNCISITLYFTLIKEMRTLIHTYLLSIQQTVKNVKIGLPDWIVRIYLDSSVYDTLQEYRNTKATDLEKLERIRKEIKRLTKELEEKDDEEFEKVLEELKKLREEEVKEVRKDMKIKLAKEISEILDYLYNSENVEIYTYFCPSIINKTTSIGRTRTYRYMPFTDPEVNVSAVREADGIITLLECHNLKIFEKSDRLFYFTPITLIDYSHISGKFIATSYSTWLKYHKKYMNSDFFSKYTNIYDILAGTVTLRMIVKRTKYDEYVNKVMNKIDSELSKDSSILFNNFKSVRYKFSMIDYSKKRLGLKIGSIVAKNMLNAGFDEILLLELFKNIISVPYEWDYFGTSGYKYSDLNDLELKRSLMFYGQFTDKDDKHSIKSFSLSLVDDDKKDLQKIMNLAKDLLTNGFIKQPKEISKETNKENIRLKRNIELLKESARKILSWSVPVQTNQLCYIFDVFMYNIGIIYNDMFDIHIYFDKYHHDENILGLINTPCGSKCREFYNNINIFQLPQQGGFNKYYKKYLKYKNKYLRLKNTM